MNHIPSFIWKMAVLMLLIMIARGTDRILQILKALK